MVPVRTREFLHEGNRLVYDEYGSGNRPLLLLPGLLLLAKCTARSRRRSPSAATGVITLEQPERLREQSIE